MEVKLMNLKGTKDFMPDEQQLRNRIKRTLEGIFEGYGYKPLETPILFYFDVLASKYAGGSEILKEVYKLNDQGDRELGLRYDLTVPFAKVIGMNPNIRMPFKRYEIGKVFRDGPVKVGRSREFIQCDVDVVGIKSMLAEAEFIAMAFEAFKKLDLEIYIQYNNRKLLSGVLSSLDISENDTASVILSLDKLEKIGEAGVRQELIKKELKLETIESLFKVFNNPESNSIEYFKKTSSNLLACEGISELEELNSYLCELGLVNKVQFNPTLARGLEIYTGTVFEIFLSDGSITSSVGGGGRYDKIIGGFLDNGIEYPAVGISFGLDVIYTALCMKQNNTIGSVTEIYIIPLGTDGASLKLAQALRLKGFSVDLEMTKRKLKKSLDYANKEGIPFVIVLGEEELKSGIVKVKDMENGEEKTVSLNEIEEELVKILG
jgi:histidyl-tRNA synthetase